MVKSKLSCSDIIIQGYLYRSKRTESFGSVFSKLLCVTKVSPLNRHVWQKRFFVLYKVRKHNKTEVFFDYYKDSTCSHLKGRVDLEHCESITENASPEVCPYTFSVETLFNGDRRVYYFLADNAESMKTWVRHLTHVTNLSDAAFVLCDHFYPNSPQIPSPSTLANLDNNTVSVTVSSSLRRRTNKSDGHIKYAPPPDSTDDDYKELATLKVRHHDEDDEYHHLPSVSHSYVNLLNTVKENHNNDDKITLRPSYSAVPLKSDNGINSNQKLIDLPTVQFHKSTDNVYYNVWETGENNINNHSLSPNTTTTTTNNNNNNEPNKRLHPENTHPSVNTRVYRRSMSVFRESSLPSPPIPTSNQIVDFGNKRNPRKPLPPPRQASTLSSFPSTLNDSPEERILPFEETNNEELALPIRAPGSKIMHDSSLDSSSNITVTSDDNLSVGNNNNNNNNITTEKLTNSLSQSDNLGQTNKIPLENDTFHSNSVIVTEKSQQLSVNTKSIEPVEVSQLNYIEPFNLDLRTQSSNNNNNNNNNNSNNIIDNDHNATTSTTAVSTIVNNIVTTLNHPTEHSTTSSLCSNSTVIQSSINVTSECNINNSNNNSNYYKDSKSANHLSTSDTLKSANNNSNNILTNQLNLIKFKPDEHIEYREIDPISTNALAIVTKRYINDDIHNNNNNNHSGSVNIL